MAALLQSPMLKNLGNLDVNLYQKGVLGMRGRQHYDDICPGNLGILKSCVWPVIHPSPRHCLGGYM